MVMVSTFFLSKGTSFSLLPLHHSAVFSLTEMKTGRMMICPFIYKFQL